MVPSHPNDPASKESRVEVKVKPRDATRKFWRVVRADVYRLSGRSTYREVFRQLMVGETFPYVFWMRACSHLSRSTGPSRLLLLPARLVLRRFRYRMGINLPWQTSVGPGIFLGHAGGIVVNAGAVIGSNCNISHNVTIGSNKGRRAGVPQIGDNVYIGPGAVVAGAITVGTGSAIGANSVVLDDVPAGVTVAGAPARVVSTKGAIAWVNLTDHGLD